MLAKAIFQILPAILFYFALAYPTMEKAIEIHHQQDFFKFKKFEWAVYVANAIPVITILLRVYDRSMSSIYIHRATIVYILKAIVQFVTIVPAVDGTLECIDRGIVEMIFLGNCADMMFSGHTAITYIMAPEKQKWLFIIPVGVTLVLGNMHYTSDVFIACIVASWVTFVIPSPIEQNTPNKLFVV